MTEGSSVREFWRSGLLGVAEETVLTGSAAAPAGVGAAALLLAPAAAPPAAAPPAAAPPAAAPPAAGGAVLLLLAAPAAGVGTAAATLEDCGEEKK